MAEKLKEKFNVTVNDELIGLNIYAAQKKMLDYKEKYNLFFEEHEDENFKLTEDITVQLARTLMTFD